MSFEESEEGTIPGTENTSSATSTEKLVIFLVKPFQKKSRFIVRISRFSKLFVAW